MPQRRISLRRLFAVMALTAGAYVTGLGLFLQFGIRPRALALQGRSEASLTAHEAIERRIAELETAVITVEQALRSATEGVPLDSASTEELVALSRSFLMEVSKPGIGSLLTGVSDEVRIALARSTNQQMQVAGNLSGAVAALTRGRRAEAIDFLIEADHARDGAGTLLGEARRISLENSIQQEADLVQIARAGARITAAWLIVGMLLALIAALLLRNRLYLPLAELEENLERVTRGDLGAMADVPPGDEIGRLAALFNRMTGVLLERAAEEEQQRVNIVERYGKILDEAASEIYALDASTLEVIESNRRARSAMGFDDDRTVKAYDMWRLDRGVIDDVLLPLRVGSRDEAVFFTDQVRRDGTITPVEVRVHRAEDSDPPALMVIVNDISERRRLEDIHEQLARFALEKSRILQSGDIAKAIEAITELAARTVAVERASVWRLADDHIQCVDLYEASGDSHTSGLELSERDFPAYFDALKTGHTIAAHDAHTDPATAQFSDSYLTPLGISSMLDSPVRVEGQLAGVVCLEHVGEQREWSTEEQVIAAALADFVTQALEVAERKRAEAALAESEHRYRTAFEDAAVGMAEVAPDGRFYRANQRLADMLGYSREELEGLTWMELTFPDDLDFDVEASQKLLRGEVATHRREKRYLHRNGSTVWVDLSTTPIWNGDEVDRFLTVIQDISEARELRSHLAHAQKMDSIGRLAGGIAHDFNNILTAILGSVELAQIQVTDGDPVKQDLEDIDRSARRASDLTMQLLTFARRQVVESRVIDVNDATRGAEKLLRRLIGEDVELETHLNADPASIAIDPGQFEQVIINLSVNARDAMPDGGVLTIRTNNVEIDSQDAESTGPAAYVSLTVSDNGTGMSEDVLGRLFEPFFTTKELGRGTGLGLATCYGIIGQAKGRIEVESEVARGSTFTVLLPVAGVAPDAVVPRDSEPSATGRETVLIVEDEEQVRHLMVRALSAKGYDVVAAADGLDAIEVLDERTEPVDAMITDTVMPRMGGPELAQHVRERYPSTKILFVSGYPEGEQAQEAIREAGPAFLPKPFTPSQLAATLRTLLEDGGA